MDDSMLGEDVIEEISLFSLGEVALVSALNRTRSECSKMSWVMMHSVRTRVRVCVQQGEKQIHEVGRIWIYRDVNVPLPCHSVYHRPCEKPNYPEPWTDDRVFATRFEVSTTSW
jgi:hypothetical protein